MKNGYGCLVFTLVLVACGGNDDDEPALSGGTAGTPGGSAGSGGSTATPGSGGAAGSETVPQAGDALWLHTLDGAPRALGVTSGVAWAGWTGVSAATPSAALALLGPDGVQTLSESGGRGLFFDLAVGADASLRLSGHVSDGLTFAGITSAARNFVLNLGASGSVTWLTEIDTGDTGESDIGVAINGAGAVFVTGNFSSALTVNGEELHAGTCSLSRCSAYSLSIDALGAVTPVAFFDSLSENSATLRSPVAYPDDSFGAILSHADGVASDAVAPAEAGSTFIRWTTANAVLSSFTTAATLGPAVALDQDRTLVVASSDVAVALGALTLDGTARTSGAVILDSAGQIAGVLDWSEPIEAVAAAPDGTVFVAGFTGADRQARYVARVDLDASVVWRNDFRASALNNAYRLAVGESALYLAMLGAPTFDQATQPTHHGIGTTGAVVAFAP